MNAEARDWARGETIALPIGDAQQVGAITFYPGGVVYLYPENDGRWSMLDCYRSEPPPHASWSNLEAAIQGTYEYVVNMGPVRRLPQR
jgi:hypothetical protein